jgi:hypothetical protein
MLNLRYKASREKINAEKKYTSEDIIKIDLGKTRCADTHLLLLIWVNFNISASKFHKIRKSIEMLSNCNFVENTNITAIASWTTNTFFFFHIYQPSLTLNFHLSQMWYKAKRQYKYHIAQSEITFFCTSLNIQHITKPLK